MKKKILVTSIHPGGINAIIPVIKKINQSNLLETIVLGHSCINIFEKNRIDFLPLQNYDYKIIEKMIKKENPYLILSGANRAIEKDGKESLDYLVTKLAKNMGVLCLSVLDFWENYVKRWGVIPEYFPDKIAVLDNTAKENMIKENFPKEIIEITGNPFFDDLFILKEKYQNKIKELRYKLNISVDKQIIMYATDIDDRMKDDGWGFNNIDCIEAICEGIVSAKKSSETEIILKKHPRETEENFSKLSKIISKYNLNSKRDENDIKLVCLASDLIVAPVSTILFEASLMNKDTISLQLGDTKGYKFIPSEIGLVPYANNKKEGTQLIKNVLIDKNFLKPYREKRKNLKVDGKATERVVNLIYKMIGVKKT